MQEAEDLDKDAQEAWLQKECGEDKDLAAQVRAMLCVDMATTGLEAIKHPYSTGGNENRSFCGRRVGPWLIERKISEGGMGSVFLAARDKAFHMKGALKVLKSGAYSGDEIRRFHHERQILAGLKHPNLARLLDGGATEEGAPYLVMEYVEGQSLDTYCNERKLTTAQRIKLFLKICTVVSYAHRNLIVHRDLKPGNILVNMEGEPILLDFGIAKLLSCDDPCFTGTSSTPMTPEYASPEQVLGQTLTTSSDVYSMGVLLYELLAGERPYAFPSRRPDIILNIICHRTPEKPGRNVVHSVNAHGIADHRGETPETLAKILTGDLDNIVMKALEKEPEDRYQTVEQLATDLSYYLAGRPVTAQAPTPLYILTKMMKLHRRSIAMVSIFLVVIMGFLAHSLHQVNQLKVKQASLLRERDNTERAMTFLEGIFEWSQPDNLRSEAIPIHQLLDFATVSMERDLKDQPLAHARLANMVGSLYMSLGYYQEARRQLETGYFLRKRHLSEDHPDFVESMFQLAVWRQKTGDYKGAGILFGQTLRIRNRTQGPSPQMADSLHAQGHVLQMTGKYEAATGLFEQALAMRRDFLGNQDPAVADTLTQLGIIQNKYGAWSQALSMLQTAANIYRQHYGPDHPDTAGALFHQARVYLNLAEYKKAETLAMQAYKLRKAQFNFKLEVAQSMELLAELALIRCQYQKAEKLLSAAWGIRKNSLGEEHPELARNMELKGRFYYHSGQYMEARTWLQKALNLRKQQSQSHQDLAHCLNLNALVLWALNEDHQAIHLLREALYHLPDNHPEAAFSHEILGHVYARQTPWRAEQSYLKALGMRRKYLKPHHPHLAQTTRALASLLLSENRIKEADPLCWESLAITHINFKNNHLDTSRDLQNLAILSWKKNIPVMADKFFKDALAICEKMADPNHPQAISLSMALQDFYKQQPQKISDLVSNDAAVHTSAPSEITPLARKATSSIKERF